VQIFISVWGEDSCSRASHWDSRRVRPAPMKTGNWPKILRNLRLLDLTEAGRRFVLVVPKYLEPGQKLPLAVLLHGLGETGNERLGAYAWVEKYGLGNAWQRLKRPPIERHQQARRMDRRATRRGEHRARGSTLPRARARLPVHAAAGGAADLDAYAKWIERSLIPRVRKETQVSEGRRADVPLRRVARRVCLARGARAHAKRVRRVGRRADRDGAFGRDGLRGEDRGRVEGLAVAASDVAPHEHARSLSAPRARRSLRHSRRRVLAATYRVVPGPHDQPWLKEAGTLEALLWLDRIGR